MSKKMYQKEHLVFEGDVLFPWIPVCVVLTTEGSKRRPQYLNELNKFKPCKKVIIQHNATFKRVYKPNVDSIDSDLLHSLQHAIKRVQRYPFALILEDDCRFHKNILDEKVRHDIFEHMSKGRCDLYSLGAGIQESSFEPPHIKVIKGCAAHAIIHTQTSMTYVSQMPFRNDIAYDSRMLDTDLSALDAYTYKRPLAIQNHPITENFATSKSKIWCPFTLRCVFRLTNAEKDGTHLYELTHMLGRHGGLYRVCRLIVGLIVAAIIITIAFTRNNTRQSAIHRM